MDNRNGFLTLLARRVKQRMMYPDHTSSLPPAPLASFDELDFYQRHFMDMELWLPYVQQICQRHRLSRCLHVYPGLAGTYPTFIVEDRWVIKLFGRLFDGMHSYTTELQAGQLLAPVFTPHPTLAVKIPAILFNGFLFGNTQDWPWPYIIFEYIPGASLGQQANRLSDADKRRVAHQIAILTRRLHTVSLAFKPGLKDAWEPYLSFLHTQRARVVEVYRQSKSLPKRLLEQLDSYLLPVEELVNLTARPHLIHADLTQDHLLGEFKLGRWRTHGLIDFGDAINGDLFYELVALHLDLFQGDKCLLAIYLADYGLDDFHRTNFARKSLSVTLLHQFNVLQARYPRIEQLDRFHTLDDLANHLWDVNSIIPIRSDS